MDNLIDWFYGQVVGFLGNFFAEMGNMGVELFDLDWVQAIVLFFSQLGWALFGVSLVVCIFECGIDYTTGRANIKDTALNILKGFLSVCLFTTVPVRLYPHFPRSGAERSPYHPVPPAPPWRRIRRGGSCSDPGQSAPSRKSP